jgi:hypothetical protein
LQRKPQRAKLWGVPYDSAFGCANPELELKKVRKAELEAELRILTAEIEPGEKKMVELPESKPQQP